MRRKLLCLLTTSLMLVAASTNASRSAYAAEPKQKNAQQQNPAEAEKAARECAEDIGKQWEMKVVKKWADPSFKHLLDNDKGQTEKMFAVVQDKLGPIKSVKRVDQRMLERGRALYNVDVDCEKAPARLLLQLVSEGKNWKLRAINFNAKALAIAPLPNETLNTFHSYVDEMVPKLGKAWSYDEFVAEADPNLVQGSPVAMRDRFIRMTGYVGPVVAYKASQLVEQGNKNGMPFATYRAFFTGSNGDGLAIVTVTLKDSKCHIAAFNIGKKQAPSAGAPQGRAMMMPGFPATNAGLPQPDPTLRGPMGAGSAAPQPMPMPIPMPIPNPMPSPGGPDLRPSITPAPANAGS